jgi:hypothetical protein
MSRYVSSSGSNPLKEITQIAWAKIELFGSETLLQKSNYFSLWLGFCRLPPAVVLVPAVWETFSSDRFLNQFVGGSIFFQKISPPRGFCWGSEIDYGTSLFNFSHESQRRQQFSPSKTQASKHPSLAFPHSGFRSQNTDRSPTTMY